MLPQLNWLSGVEPVSVAAKLLNSHLRQGSCRYNRWLIYPLQKRAVMAGSVMECGTDWRPSSTIPRSRSGTRHRFANVATVVELACITVLAVSGYLSGAGQYDLLTDDEIRYTEAGRQMLRTGDWIVPVYNGEPRYQKPLLVYWLQAISQGLFGNHALAARIPSALAAAMTLLSTWSIARTVWDASTARWTVLVLGTMVEFVLLARMVLIDMLLVACLQASVAAMLSAWHAKSVLARSFRYQWAGLALGLAVCAKGPLAVLLFILFALPLVMVMRRMRRRGGDSCGEPRQSARLDETLAFVRKVCREFADGVRDKRG
jgi:hypothetical protein